MNKALFTQIRAHANEYLLIVTGSGHHTKGASLNNRNSKLFETVKSFLINWNLTFQIVKDGNGYEGAFRISTNL